MTAPIPKDWDEGYFVNNQGLTQKGSKEGGKEWISEGYAYIDTIQETHTKSGVDRYFIIRGKPIHSKEFSFRIKATDASDKRKLRAALVNEYGIDVLGKLDLQVIQKLSGIPIGHRLRTKRPIT